MESSFEDENRSLTELFALLVFEDVLVLLVLLVLEEPATVSIEESRIFVALEPIRCAIPYWPPIVSFTLL